MLIALMPAIAYATNVSSDDGSGTQSLTSKGAWSWAASGKLKSTSGSKVYYSGKIVYDWNTDENCGRYTTDTTSTTLVTRGGTCSGPIRADTADGAEYRVCRNINNLPDDCGSWSSEESY